MAAKGDGFMSVTEARRKCREKYSCFRLTEVIEHMSLPPCYIGRLKEGINEELSKKRMKYCENLQGVIIAFDKVKLIQRYGSVVDESPYLHFDVKVNYIVFQPEIDSILVGEVNKLGYNHIGCLVHGCLNASIAKPRQKNGYDITSLSLGSDLKFRVIGLESLNGVLSISGVFDDKSLRRSNKPKSTSIDNLSLESEPAPVERISPFHGKSSKKHKINFEEMVPRKIKKDINGNQSAIETSTADNQYNIGSAALKLVRKKSKKKKKIYTL